MDENKVQMLKAVLVWFLTAEADLKLPGLFNVQAPPVLLLALLILFLWSLRWIARDAEKRGKSSGVAVLFAILASWPISLLFWRWLRPPLVLPPASVGAFEIGKQAG